METGEGRPLAGSGQGKPPARRTGSPRGGGSRRRHRDSDFRPHPASPEPRMWVLQGRRRDTSPVQWTALPGARTRRAGRPTHHADFEDRRQDVRCPGRHGPPVPRGGAATPSPGQRRGRGRRRQDRHEGPHPDGGVPQGGRPRDGDAPLLGPEEPRHQGRHDRRRRRPERPPGQALRGGARAPHLLRAGRDPRRSPGLRGLHRHRRAGDHEHPPAETPLHRSHAGEPRRVRGHGRPLRDHHHARREHDEPARCPQRPAAHRHPAEHRQRHRGPGGAGDRRHRLRPERRGDLPAAQGRWTSTPRASRSRPRTSS